MPHIIRPDAEQMKVLEDLEIGQHKSCVILSPAVVAELEASGIDPEEAVSETYDLTDADCWMELVTSTRHYALTSNPLNGLD